MPKLSIVKNNGEEELYNKNKLIDSLNRAKVSNQVIKEIVKDVEEILYNGISTTEIYKQAYRLLKNREKNSAIKYSIRRSLLNLGPSGFPFEKFIGQIYQAKGYKVKIGQMLQGKCSKHEIDVIAYNDKELLLMEVKFHNQLAIKTDTKVALYVKARFDDLRDQVFSINGKQMKMTRAILITNTKFTDNAKDFIKCSGGIDMIGFDFPSENNLYNLIEETAIHPITCIPQLSTKEKRALLDKGIVNCLDIKDKKQVLEEIGLGQAKIRDIISNIDQICAVDHK